MGAGANFWYIRTAMTARNLIRRMMYISGKAILSVMTSHVSGTQILIAIRIAASTKVGVTNPSSMTPGLNLGLTGRRLLLSGGSVDWAD